jgi:hypothetical protein
MKARKITKVVFHYLKNDKDSAKYHFVNNKEVVQLMMPLFSVSPLDNDANAIHYGCVKCTEIPDKFSVLINKMGYKDLPVEIRGEIKKPKNEKDLSLESDIITE